MTSHNGAETREVDKISEEVKKRKKVLRAGITKTCRRIQDALKSDTDTDIDELLAQLDRRESDYLWLSRETSSFSDSLASEQELERDEEYLDLITATRVRAKKEKAKTLTADHTISTSEDNSATTDQGSPNVKLPKIQVQPFDGNLVHFQSFWDTFNSSIHSNKTLSNVDKFVYLKTLLTGDASIAIAGIEVSDSNYDLALEVIRTRFAKPEVVINSLLTKLVSLKPVKRSRDVRALRELYDTVVISMRSLENIGIKSSSYGIIFRPIIVKQLPWDLALTWNRDFSESSKNDFEVFLKFLRNEVEGREQTFAIAMNAEPEKEQQKGDGRRNSKEVSNIYLNTSATACIFCKKSHSALHCDSDIDIKEKLNQVRKSGVCFKCFKPGHRAFKCKYGRKCKHCSGNHHDSICTKSETFTNDTTKLEPLPEVSINLIDGEDGAMCLPVLQVLAVSKKRTVKTNILIDSGSQCSFISNRLREQLQLDTDYEKIIDLSVFGDKEKKRNRCSVVHCQLSDMRAIRSVEMTLLSIPVLTNNITFTIPNKYGETIIQTAAVDIIIGCDQYSKIFVSQHINNKIITLETIIGSCSYGCIKSDSSSLCCNIDTDCPIDLQIFWDAEKFLLSSDKNNWEESKDYTTFCETIKYSDCTYTVRLLWKIEPVSLNSNYRIANLRLRRLVAKLQTEKLYNAYEEIIQEYMQKQFIERCNLDIEQGYFMPHRAVIREQSETTKIRIVFDASSHERNALSLNDFLYKGTNLYSEMLAILVRFRMQSVAICGDLEKAFLMIKLAEDDKKFTKFLWLGANNEVVSFRFRVVPFGIKCSPFLLCATLKYHVDNYPSDSLETNQLLRNCFYVDDFVATTHSLQSGFKLCKDVKEILLLGGFNIRKWISNDKELLGLLADQFGIENVCNKTKHSVLGITWDTCTDELVFDLQFKRMAVTKRSLLSTLARVFDPLGLLSPITIRMKILLQRAWQLGLGWDDRLPDDMLHNLPENEFLMDRQYTIRIQRHVGQFENFVALHTYCDASESAYGACTYMICEKNNLLSSRLLVAKACVCPIKRLTVPKLELLAATVGAKLAHRIKNMLEIPTQSLRYFSDSSITIGWIKHCKDRKNSFINNRIAEIQQISSPEQWSHCTGIANPADCLTRGCSIENLAKNQLWLYGPAIPYASSLSPIQPQPVSTYCIYQDGDLYDLERFGSFQKLIRTIAYVHRFAKRKRYPSIELETEELLEAEFLVIFLAQRRHFAQEICAILSERLVSKSSILYGYFPFVDESGLMRCNSRLSNSKKHYFSIHPIIIPDCRLADLLIWHCHNEIFHMGVQATLSRLRQKYMIYHARKRIKAVIRACTICRRYNAKPIALPEASLPADRVTQSKPFSVVGVDFAGPFYVKEQSNTKAYAILFCCGVTRAVHIELVENESVDYFMLAFKRFIARRGLCCVIYSDNAPTFKCANQDLQTIWRHIKSDELKRFYAKRAITWKFIVEHAPWWGGFYERMVGTTKLCIKRSLSRTILKFTELATMLTEIESCINSRPLTYVYNDCNEPEALTPQHFLIQGKLSSLPDTTLADINCKQFINRRIYMENLLTHFWLRWSHEYLVELRNFNKVKYKSHGINAGDIVLLRDEKQPRQLWRFGLVLKLIEGNDGISRAALVKTNQITTRRPIQDLVNLEVKAQTGHAGIMSSSNNDP